MFGERSVDNQRVLPLHAQLISRDGQVFIRYMQSSAAVWVNGSPASQQALQDRDEIVLGDFNTRLTLLFNKNAVGVPSPINQLTRSQVMQRSDGTMSQSQFPTPSLRANMTDRKSTRLNSSH